MPCKRLKKESAGVFVVMIIKSYRAIFGVALKNRTGENFSDCEVEGT